jgi:hypothetical protein
MARAAPGGAAARVDVAVRADVAARVDAAEIRDRMANRVVPAGRRASGPSIAK